MSIFSKLFRKQSEPEDAHVDLLRDLSLGKPEPLAEYRRLLADPAARQGLFLPDDASEEDVKDHCLLQVVADYMLAAIMDWKAEPDETVGQFAIQFARHGAPMAEDREKALAEFGEQNEDEDGGQIIPLVGPMIEEAEKRGLGIMYMELSSDSFDYVIAKPEICAKWLSKSVSEAISFSKA